MPPKKAPVVANPSESSAVQQVVEAAIPVSASIIIGDSSSAKQRKIHEFVVNENEDAANDGKVKKPRYRSEDLTTYTSIVNKLNAELGISKEAALELLGDKITGKTPSRMTLWRHQHPKVKDDEVKIDRRTANVEFDLAVQTKLSSQVNGGLNSDSNDLISYDLIRKAAEEVQSTDPR